MSNTADLSVYPAKEEFINIYSHALGFLLSVVATVLLVVQAINYQSGVYLFSGLVFGLSLMALYAASTFYHREQNPERRARLRVLDHSSIYLLIAGTYTPFMLVTLKGPTGWTIFLICWAMALAGIVLKWFYTGKFKLLSTSMYLFMGWMILFAIKPLAENLAPQGLNWLIAGGVAYTLGAVLYSIKPMPYNHAIFHIFVLAGSTCHFIAVYRFILPVPSLL